MHGTAIMCSCPTARDHTLSFSGLPDTLVPIFPVQMRGEIPSMSGLPFNRRQVPLTLGFAITDYTCRDSTFTGLVLDLRFPERRVSIDTRNGPLLMSSSED
jgi:hypothetical protein